MNKALSAQSIEHMMENGQVLLPCFSQEGYV